MLGAMARPGTYVLRGDRRLFDVLMEAGGATASSIGQVVLIQQGRADETPSPEPMVLSMERLLAAGHGDAANPPLTTGDIIFVPGAEKATDGAVVEGQERSVTIVGEVARPGIFRLGEGGSALSAVLAAGGLTKFAAPNRAKVIRSRDGRRSTMPLELGSILKDGDKKKDVLLEPGDMIIVPTRIF